MVSSVGRAQEIGSNLLQEQISQKIARVKAMKDLLNSQQVSVQEIDISLNVLGLQFSEPRLDDEEAKELFILFFQCVKGAFDKESNSDLGIRIFLDIESVLHRHFAEGERAPFDEKSFKKAFILSLLSREHSLFQDISLDDHCLDLLLVFMGFWVQRCLLSNPEQVRVDLISEITESILTNGQLNPTHEVVVQKWFLQNHSQEFLETSSNVSLLILFPRRYPKIRLMLFLELLRNHSIPSEKSTPLLEIAFQTALQEEEGKGGTICTLMPPLFSFLQGRDAKDRNEIHPLYLTDCFLWIKKKQRRCACCKVG